MSRKNPGALRALRPLATHDYRLLFAAVGIEVFGTGLRMIVIVLQVLALNDSPSALSAVATGMSLGLFAFSILGGVVADKFSKRRIIITLQGCSVVVMAAVAALSLTGTIELWHGLEGALRPSSGRGIGRALGGIIVGAFFHVIGAAIVAASYAVAFVIVLFLSRQDEMADPATPAEKTNVWGDLRAGVRYVAALGGCSGHSSSDHRSHSSSKGRSKCSCRSSPATDSRTWRRRSGFSWQRSGSAARSARSSSPR